MAGIISATGNALRCIIRSPVAISKKPPQALKSVIIAGVVNGMTICANAYKSSKIAACGIPMSAVAVPRMHAKITAVKKSKTDFANKKITDKGKFNGSYL